MTQAYDGFVHLGFQTEMVVQFPTRNTKKVTLEYQRIIQMPMVFLTIS